MGVGYWGTKLVNEYLALSKSKGSFELNSVIDFASEKLEEIKDKFGSYNLTFSTDYDKMLLNDWIDAVHIATPNHTHYELARKALERGKHVLLEKPMTLSCREAFKLARVAEENGLVLQVGHIFRFNNALEIGKQIIRTNKLGKVFYVNLNWASYLEPPKGRDIVFDLMPHPVDILNYFLDEWPSAVHAIGKSYLRNEDYREEAAFTHLEFPNDVLGNIYVSWLHHGVKERNVTIVGDKATMQIDALNQRVTLADDKAVKEIFVVPNNTMQSIQSHFIDRITGRGPSYNSAIIGAVTVQVLEAIQKSMKTGLRVEIIGD